MNGWAIEYDGGNQEDEYGERPSEFIIRQTQRACPDEPVRVLYIENEKRKVVETRPALGRKLK